MRSSMNNSTFILLYKLSSFVFARSIQHISHPLSPSQQKNSFLLRAQLSTSLSLSFEPSMDSWIKKKTIRQGLVLLFPGSCICYVEGHTSTKKRCLRRVYSMGMSSVQCTLKVVMCVSAYFFEKLEFICIR